MLSTITLAAAGFASKMVAPTHSSVRATVRMEEAMPPPPPPPEPMQSKAIPFLKAPALLDGSMAGDNGFDPLACATSESRLAFYREAEIRHCRLAMLAAANWPLAELLNKPIAKVLGVAALTDATGGRAPSIPNGGLGQVNAIFWFLVLAIGAFAEVGEISPLEPSAKIAGDLGFDPLGLWGKMDTKGKRDMQDKELANGRLAMVAITAFVAQEFVSKAPAFPSL
jgi:hypothetical protein